MSLTVNDLQPKNFKINIQGVEVECKPPRLSDSLIMSKVGEMLTNPENHTAEELQQVEADIDMVISKLVPDLKDITLTTQGVIDFVLALAEQVAPSDDRELAEKGVSFESDPKEQSHKKAKS